MTNELRIETVRTGYADIVRHVLRNGMPVAPRGIPTREIVAATIIVEHPARDNVATGVGRALNPAIIAAETSMLVAEMSHPRLICTIAPQFSAYMNDDDRFHGAYGPRLIGQLDQLVTRLASDRDSRRGVLQIWDSRRDLGESRDIPCTMMLVFQIRNDRLDAFTYMRSNDVWLGTPYDFGQFIGLQLTLAWAIGVEPGRYTHHAVSLHIYDKDVEKVDKLHDPQGDATTFGGLRIESLPRAYRRLTYARKAAEVALLGESYAREWWYRDLSDSHHWYFNQLKPFHTEPVYAARHELGTGSLGFCPRCRTVLQSTQFDRGQVNCRTCMWAQAKLKPRNLDEHDYYEMLRKQNGCCAVCKEKMSGQRLRVDHDHATGIVRGLLCFRCNTTLGSTKDNPQLLRELASYLDGEPVTRIYGSDTYKP